MSASISSSSSSSASSISGAVGVVAPMQSQLKNKEEVAAQQTESHLSVSNFPRTATLLPCPLSIITECLEQLGAAYKNIELKYRLKNALLQQANTETITFNVNGELQTGRESQIKEMSQLHDLVSQIQEIAYSLICLELNLENFNRFHICWDTANSIHGLMLMEFHEVTFCVDSQTSIPEQFVHIQDLAIIPLVDDMHHMTHNPNAVIELVSHAAATALQYQVSGVYLRSLPILMPSYKACGFKEILSSQLNVLKGKQHNFTNLHSQTLLILKGEQLKNMAARFFQRQAKLGAPASQPKVTATVLVPSAPAAAVQAQAKLAAPVPQPKVAPLSAPAAAVQAQAKEKVQNLHAPTRTLQTTSWKPSKRNCEKMAQRAKKLEDIAYLKYFKAIILKHFQHGLISDDDELFKNAKETLFTLESECCQSEDPDEPEIGIHVCKDNDHRIQGLMLTKLHRVISTEQAIKQEGELLEICDLVTHPANIRSVINKNEKTRIQGAGTSMITHAIKIAKDHRVFGIYLGSLRLAIGFYEKFKFKPMDYAAFDKRFNFLSGSTTIGDLSLDLMFLPTESQSTLNPNPK